VKYSFGILKPDCVRRGLVDDAFTMVRKFDLEIILYKKTLLTVQDVEFLYSRCSAAPFFQNLVRFMTSGEVVVYLVRSSGEMCAIKALNKATGYTDPLVARPGTLRSMGTDVCENIAHSTSDQESFWAEVRHFLPGEVNALKLES